MEPRYALTSASVMLGPVPVQLVKDRAYAADDPLVIQYPSLFSSRPDIYDCRGNVVEAATSAPGEKRTVRRGV